MGDTGQIVWALGFVGVAIALSAWQKLDLEGNLIIAAGRSILQLLVVGFVLTVVFSAPLSPFLIFFVIAVLWLIASIFTRNQISQDLDNLLPWVAGSLLIGTTVTVGFTQLLIVKPVIWYEPQFLIPLSAIVLSNAMNGAAIAGKRLIGNFNANQLEIETHLCLGASWQHAIAPYRKDAIRAGVLPTLNTMTIVGLATLPSVLSGQLLGGATPVQAIGLQIVVLLMLAFSTLVTAIVLSHGISRQFFNKAGQFVV